MNHETAKARVMRETILRVLYNTFAAAPGVCVLLSHLHQAFSTSTVPPLPEEVNGQIVDLVEDGLIVAAEAPGVSSIPQKCYSLTSKGRDFYRARCPWDKLDEFTGGQKL